VAIWRVTWTNATHLVVTHAAVHAIAHTERGAAVSCEGEAEHRSGE
jgi:hypothetical protein